MKIRNGFVSNSSSSSFIIYGIEIEDSDLREVLGASKSDPDPDLEFLDLHEPDYSLDGYVDSALQGTGLKYIRDWDNGTFFIGLVPWSGQEEYETKAEFKARAQKALNEFMKKPVQLELHEGIIYS